MADEDTSQPPVEPTAPAELAPAPEVAPSEPVQTTPPETAPSTQGSGEPTQSAQIPVNEPLPPEPEPPQAASASVAPAPASTSSPQATHASRDLLVKARATIQTRKQKKLEKILEALDGKGPTTLKLRRAGKITNDEVEKLLHVSDATATRYLSALEKEGKIKQVGKTGKAVTYTKP
ncbi:hypothetical protein A2763_03380 [Candidatus Kaiserbacteria bacterium RIFCSPHIGHO2_01_FULL_54_36]|uniref:Uncharacterized protein n=1 Tax=Candidatus Kaiserbacteria bacterium RIFCSPHIGHO2_01_FULL_54_36 TaxID=1798482 RepID=A0A1F6CKM9_9BACT|nr:MAG: hypothetical protein A2763_03380 [Candidatus Kaiserbacteria bacterium RIFCSPHIGHO2_01_FULL_54_36]OGG75925.1 MAG: hypothetical protein A3A41_00520 [Candidatus Kaiserbacteria bacterium RIFCSPLOWO2_01_FULL_54_22]